LAEILHAGPAQVVIDPEDGGRLTSLRLDGIELLGGENPKPGEPPSWFHGSFPMAPFAGRLSRGHFDFQGTGYDVPPNWGAHAGHGVVFDVPWQVEERRGPTRLRMRTAFDARWPLGGFARQDVHLTRAHLTITLQVLNDERHMPASAGFHPWFRRDLGTGGNARLTLRPSGRYVSGEAGAALLTTDLGRRPWDDVLTGFAEPPTISWPNGPTLVLTGNTDTWVVFEQLADAFCVEPLTDPPDSLGTPIGTVVSPGAPLELRFRIAWGS